MRPIRLVPFLLGAIVLAATVGVRAAQPPWPTPDSAQAIPATRTVHQGQPVTLAPGEIVDIDDPTWDQRTSVAKPVAPAMAPGPMTPDEFLQRVLDGTIPISYSDALRLVRERAGQPATPHMGASRLIDTGITYWRNYWDGVDNTYSCSNPWEVLGANTNGTNQTVTFTLEYTYTKTNGYSTNVSVDSKWVSTNIGYDVTYSESIKDSVSLNEPPHTTVTVYGQRNSTCNHFLWHADHIRVYWDTDKLAFVEVVFETSRNSGTAWKFHHLALKETMS